MSEIYDEKLRAQPLPYKLPCLGCKHIRRKDEDYYFCAYLPPQEVLGWQKLKAFGAYNDLTNVNSTSRWLTQKQVDDPHAADAIMLICDARTPIGGGRL